MITYTNKPNPIPVVIEYASGIKAIVKNDATASLMFVTFKLTAPLTIKQPTNTKALAAAADGIDAKVINIHTIKPLDEELIVAAAKETGKVVTIEEHSVIGGLGSAVCDCLSEKAPTKVLKIGVNDTYGESGPAVELIKKYGLDSEGIYAKVKAFMA